VAEFPNMIKNTFLTKSLNDAGIIGVKLYIRGKPWVITIDDEFLYSSRIVGKLWFTKVDVLGEAMWAAILEKAWAKVKNTYS
jgi:hypothetical protein